MKFFTILAGLFLMCSSVFGQINVDLSDPNPVDSAILSYKFCLVIPEISNGYVTLQCNDKDGQMYHLRFREDLFSGKITIQIHPNEELGPITEEKIWNLHVLPEVVPDTGIIEYEIL